MRLWRTEGFGNINSIFFSAPFYYIDYTLAWVCAVQFWKKANTDFDAAWSDYLRLCEAGGSKPFLELVQLAKLRSPFDPGCLKDTLSEVESWIEREVNPAAV